MRACLSNDPLDRQSRTSTTRGPRYEPAGRAWRDPRTLPPTVGPARGQVGAGTWVGDRRRRRSGMSTSPRARVGRIAVSALFIAVALTPAASPALAADPLVLKVGTDQTFSGLNPWQSVYVLDYEVFTLNYDLLVGYDQNLGYAPDYAESWTVSPDGKTTTFKIRAGMKWSDGEPATAEDARYTYQLAIDAAKQELTMGSGYIDGYLSSAGLKSVTAPDATTLVVET